ncbi:hypothetical protein FRC0552_01998 [Corynebacterium diphtheriae]|nr:hypothetical protein FRC0552_01998 [Corynebacterium diphtheriae]
MLSLGSCCTCRSDGEIQEGAFARGGQGTVDADGVAKHGGHIADNGRVVCDGFDTVAHHGIAEGAAHGDFGCTGGYCFCSSVFVNTGAEFFFHEHAGTASATAEAFVAVAVHFHEFHSGNTQKFAWWVEDFVVSAEEARIMVGDRCAVFWSARDGGKQAFAD